VEYDIGYDPDDERNVQQTAAIEKELNESLYKQGAFFARPYGSQAEIAYQHNSAYTATLHALKQIFDPNRIMNPGKLCF
jgi:FAD/FMN-containing dehydrogenase